MKFHCNKEKLQRMFLSTDCTSLVTKDSLLEVSDKDGLLISGTDNEIYIKIKEEATVELEGKMLLNTKKIIDILKSLPTCDILITTDENYNVVISSMTKGVDTKFKMQGKSIETFPEVITHNDGEYFKISQPLLKETLKRVSYAISRDGRQLLNGVLFEKKPSSNILNIVALDGYKMALVKHQIENLDKYEDFRCLIPSKTINEIIRLLDSEGECEICLTENRGFFKINNAEISTVYIENEFPEYETAVPVTSGNIITINTEVLMDSVKRVSSILSEKVKRICLKIKQNSMNIISEDLEVGSSAEEQIPIEYNKEDTIIDVNYEFFMQTIKEINGETVLIDVGNSKAMIVNDPGTPNALAVLSKMRPQ